MINIISLENSKFLRVNTHKNACSIKLYHETKPKTIAGLDRRSKEHQRHFDISSFTSRSFLPATEQHSAAQNNSDHLHFAAELKMKESHERIFCATLSPLVVFPYVFSFYPLAEDSRPETNCENYGNSYCHQSPLPSSLFPSPSLPH